MIQVEKAPHARVQWTPGERHPLLAKLAALLAAQGLRAIPEGNDRYGRQIFLDYFRQAQCETLLPERRRLIGLHHGFLGKKGFAELEKLLGLAWQKKDAEKAAASSSSNGNGSHPPAIPEAPKEILLKDAELPELLTALGARLEADRAELAELLDESLKETVSAIRLTKQTLETLTARVAALEGPELKAGASAQQVTLEAPAAPTRLPRVAVIGCQVREFRHIQEQAEKRGLPCELIHYEQNSRPTYLKGEYALYWRFCRHAWPELAMGVIRDRAKVVPVSGIGNAVQQLETWFQKAP